MMCVLVISVRDNIVYDLITGFIYWHKP